MIPSKHPAYIHIHLLISDKRLFAETVIEASETASIEVKSVAAVVYFDETEGLVHTY